MLFFKYAQPTTNQEIKMSFRMSDFEHRNALMACLREIQNDEGNELFSVQDDAYGYNADSQCVFVMLESKWEGYTLAVACPIYSDAMFIVTDDETGEEENYHTYEALMEAFEEEDDEEEDSDEEESDEEEEEEDDIEEWMRCHCDCCCGYWLPNPPEGVDICHCWCKCGILYRDCRYACQATSSKDEEEDSDDDDDCGDKCVLIHASGCE